MMVHERNIKSLHDAIRALTQRVNEQQSQIDQQNARIATMGSQVAALEQALNMFRARALGSGPTV